VYRAYHLALTEKDVEGVRLALLPGAPERVEVLARAFGEVRILAVHREFKSALAIGEEGEILVVSTGIGGPSLSIAVEELARLGIQWFIRVGTCGAIQPDIAVGDLVVSEGAVRLDGASLHYAPVEYPAVSDWRTVVFLQEACEEAGVPYHLGITCSSANVLPGTGTVRHILPVCSPEFPGKPQGVAGTQSAELRDGSGDAFRARPGVRAEGWSRLWGSGEPDEGRAGG